MKAINAIKVAGGALLIAASFQAFAQTSEAAPAADQAAAAKSQHKADTAANRALGRKVRTALSKALGTGASHITVRASHGNIVLQGSVPEQDLSDKATEIAKGVDGVASVKNALSIRAEGT